MKRKLLRNGDKIIREAILKDITAKDYSVIGITPDLFTGNFARTS